MLLTCCRAYAQGVTPPTDGKVVVPGRAVLTNNPDAGELGLNSGVTYTAAPAFDNPQDPQHTRLIDGDKPVANWNVVAGINAPAQTVTFDLKKSYALEEVALHLSSEHKPATVAVAVARESAGPWQELGVLKLEDQTAPWWRLKLSDALRRIAGARFVRLDFKIKNWGWYINEVKIYGSLEGAAQAARRVNGQLVLADKGRPHAVIVLADRTYPNALRAAALFQSLAYRMTGAQLPILPESQFNGKATAILIGDSKLARKRGVTVEQTPLGDDRYVLRGAGARQNFIALVGNDAPYGDLNQPFRTHFRGSIFAVYDFFERRGCGWYGPDDLWQVIPKINTLSTAGLAVQEAPAFAWRRIWMNGLPWDSPLREAWRQGGTEIAAGHNYDTLVPPAIHKEKHPEWFGKNQPDLTHPEVIRTAVETLSREMQANPHQALMTFSASANDTGGFKENPFKPEVGNIAAQQLYFTNEIAKGLRQKHPKRRFKLGVLGYWHSHDGPVPMLAAEPEVVVMMVNEGNHAKPLEWPESAEIARTTGRNNTRELRGFAQWKKTGGLTAIYEWWIPVLANKTWQEVPWYDGDTAVANLRFWHRNGIRYVDYESQGEANGGFSLRWAQYYIGARASWNPNINAREVLLSACRKLFGAAGETMAAYYNLQEQAMRETNERGGNWSLPLPHLLYGVEVEQRGEALLQKAQAQAIGEPERARIAVEATQWKRLRELDAAARAEQKKSFKAVLNGVGMNWNEQTINAATVRDLFDLPVDAPLEVVEKDGQNRRALAGEVYDLASGVTFRTIKPD